MKHALRKEKDKFEALFNHASMGIVVTNAMGEIEMANKNLLNQFGYTHLEELTGKKIEVLIPSRYDARHKQYREAYSKHPQPRVMGVGRDLFGLKKNGVEFPVEISLSNYQADDGMFIIAFVIDITLRKEIENAYVLQKELLTAKTAKIEELNNELEEKVALRTQQLEKAMMQLEQSRDEVTSALNKEKELGDLKSRFVSMASHEFRTPLSTILSSASLLAKYTESEDQEKRDKHINRIKSSVNNLTDILNDLLSIGKIEGGKIDVRYSEFNIREFFHSVCNEMQLQAKPSQTIHFSHTGNDVIISDSSILRNIVFNLLSNAIKFTNDGGNITVTSSVDNNDLTIVIADDGIGISKADMVHLFERFFRAENAVNIQGTGLGLHIVQKYTEILGGTIQVKSVLEAGTSVSLHFRLPQA